MKPSIRNFLVPYSAVAIAALTATTGLAEATTAGHMLKSTTPATPAAANDITGSTARPGGADAVVTGATKNHHVNKPNTVNPKTTGAPVPQTGTGQ
jgi:hypothetical protein